jgi:molecular chaperone GrpE
MTDPRHDIDPPHAEPPSASGSAEATAPPGIEERLAELEDRWKRALAEAENQRRLKERDVDEARKFAATRFARDMLEVGDNLARALAAVPAEARAQSADLANLLAGVEMTHRTLLAVFERHQIRPIQPERGERFDPQRHQAMFEVETDAHPPGTIAEVVQAGYGIADRLLRPAMVGVAKAPAAAAPSVPGDPVGERA